MRIIVGAAEVWKFFETLNGVQLKELRGAGVIVVVTEDASCIVDRRGPAPSRIRHADILRLAILILHGAHDLDGTEVAGNGIGRGSQPDRDAMIVDAKKLRRNAS